MDRVPPFQRYFSSRSDMTPDQVAFFDYWRERWLDGEVIPVNGNISYLYCYLYSVLTEEPRRIIQELKRFRHAFANEPSISDYCSIWISDAYIVLGDLHAALSEIPKPRLGSRSSSLADSTLSIRLHLGLDVDPDSLLALAGPRVTRFGRKHLDQIRSYMATQLAQREHHNEPSLLDDWAQGSHRYTYFVFSGSSFSTGLEHLPAYSFSLNPRALEFAAQQARTAENAIRDELGVCAIGEGWISETELYYQIKAAFPAEEVIQHARPAWLGLQHLDVFLPRLQIAIEFQGSQHDRPVDFFGGEEAFRQVQKRDTNKKRKCNKNGVTLIEVRPGYELNHIVETIQRSGETAP